MYNFSFLQPGRETDNNNKTDDIRYRPPPPPPPNPASPSAFNEKESALLSLRAKTPPHA